MVRRGGDEKNGGAQLFSLRAHQNLISQIGEKMQEKRGKRCIVDEIVLPQPTGNFFSFSSFLLLSVSLLVFFFSFFFFFLGAHLTFCPFLLFVFIHFFHFHCSFFFIILDPLACALFKNKKEKKKNEVSIHNFLTKKKCYFLFLFYLIGT